MMANRMNDVKSSDLLAAAEYAANDYRHRPAKIRLFEALMNDGIEYRHYVIRIRQLNVSDDGNPVTCAVEWYRRGTGGVTLTRSGEVQQVFANVVDHINAADRSIAGQYRNNDADDDGA